ncbi:para-aminobenzoate synthase, (PABA) [Mycoblastus sanguinarius]|nr:para-aminobenzoate synthase, (PABA) [Mycoblastus sanguinarius]
MPHATAIQRVLFIDAYDSFTNNIVCLLETHLRVEVTVIKIDDNIANFAEFLRPYTAVVAGPGPGDPRNTKDVGLIQDLWNLNETDLLPVLGICLGFQSLVLAFGGKVERLPKPRHGIVRRVRSNGGSIFSSIGDVQTVQYHSLHATLGHNGCIISNGPTNGARIWEASSTCPDLRPLAWDCDVDNGIDGLSRPLPMNPGSVLMAVEHKTKPFWGIQFHAESICSNEDAQCVILSWWKAAVKWRIDFESTRLMLDRRPSSATPKTVLPSVIPKANGYGESPLRRGRTFRGPREILDYHSDCFYFRHEPRMSASAFRDDLVAGVEEQGSKPKLRVITRAINVGHLTVPKICTSLGLAKNEAIILDSEQHQRHEVGECSIIGLVSPGSLRLEYNVGKPFIRQICNGNIIAIDLEPFEGSVFTFLKDFMKQRQAKHPYTTTPFWGGLMGFVTYEACLETIGAIHYSMDKPRVASQRPDLSFVFVERSIVIDHRSQNVHIQSIKPTDHSWVTETSFRLEINQPQSDKGSFLPSFDAEVSLPNERKYKSQIRACQASIRAGDSYELCLTTQATIKTPVSLPAWPLFLRLRNLNPAPFSAYIRLGKLTLLSSSPERFLRWSRPSKLRHDELEKTSICQFRPIKGTVKRQPNPNHPPLTLAEATALLSTPKERAENLMIVDLIRHDLHGVVGPGRVAVPKLMVVEEYATLFQLVSVVEGSMAVDESDEDIIDDDSEAEEYSEATLDGQNLRRAPLNGTPNVHISSQSIKPLKSICNAKTGMDVLSSSLPPGSMTGAPKLRSCQILQQLENRKRGVYSGVVGYIDVGGGGDFSVVIRSAVRWDDESGKRDEGKTEDDKACHREPRNENEEDEKGDTWTIGAGGAVTSLSTEDGEWEEMLAKLKSTLRLFDNDEM